MQMNLLYSALLPAPERSFFCFNHLGFFKHYWKDAGLAVRGRLDNMHFFKISKNAIHV